MHIDSVSQKIIKIALFLDNKLPGVVSEIWIDKDDLKSLKTHLPKDVASLIRDTQDEINVLKDLRRKKYLTDVLLSLQFQIESVDKKVSFPDFSEEAYQYRIERVSDKKLNELKQQIKK